MSAHASRDDPLAALRAAVSKAAPEDRPAVAVRTVRAMAAAGMDDAVRITARAWIKANRLIEPIFEFDKLVRAHTPPPATPGATHAHLHTPPALARDQDILGRAVVCMRVCMGLVGEQATAQLQYLALTSRLLAKPVSTVVKGLSSSGKSFTLECVERLFPAEAKLVMTAMSERALVYLAEDFAHRTVILYEAVGLRENRDHAEENTTAYIVRSLLSEGRIAYPAVVKGDDGRMRTEWFIKQGPTNLLTTTTSVTLHAENETRMLSLPSDESAAQTAAVLLAECGDGERREPNLRPWHRLQCWLAQANHEVVIPFDRCIAAQIRPDAARLRRDWRAVRSLIRAHAMLHQLSRETDGRGRVIATIADYAVVHGLVADLVAEGIGATVPAKVRQTVEAVEQLQPAKVTDVAKRLGIERSAAHRRIATARHHGYVENISESGAARYVPGEPMPGEIAVLPDPDRVCACARGVHGCLHTRKPGEHDD